VRERCSPPGSQAVVVDAAYGEPRRPVQPSSDSAWPKVAVPYFVGARLIGTAARESQATIANRLAPSA
jgi:hypothetical protein